MADLSADAVVQRGPDGRILYANAAFARLLPDTEPPVGTRARPLRLDSGPVSHRSDGTREYDEAIICRDGVRWYAWAETRATRPDGAGTTVACGREITDRIKAERSLERDRARAEAASTAKSRFLATVSHEFRTPLNGILGMAGLLVDTPLDPEQSTYVQAVRSSAEAFLSLIEEVLDLSKIEAGRLDLASEPFDVEALVEGVVELLAPRAQDKGVEISGYVAAGVPRRLVGDRDRLRQMLLNLAGNAVKFTEQGGVGVSVETEADGTLVFAVEDTGTGIPAERLDSIFEEFEQEATPSRDSGTGLGLAITRRLVARMGGRIDVASRMGEGSRFAVRLRLPVAAEAVPERPAALLPPTGLAGARVLIVAPALFQAGFLVRALRDAGLHGIPVEGAEAAAVVLARTRIDIVIADRALGAEAVRRVAERARAAGVARTIVMLSPYERRDLGSPHATGFDAYLVKPVRARSLRAQLRPHPVLPPRSAVATGVATPSVRPGAVRVLLAEDNDVNALLAIRVLEKLGALVDWAKDGDEAIAMAEAAMGAASSQGAGPGGATPDGARSAYDLILMDLRMPRRDGLAVTRHIRAREAETRQGRTRIVALTASLMPGDEAAGRAAGCDGFLTKPFTFEALRAAMPSEAELARAS